MSEKSGFSRRGLLRNSTVAGVGLAAGKASTAKAGADASVPAWSREADVVVVGAGAVGLTAAIVARETGASVIVVEAQSHVGGHAITSGGDVPLGGGTSAQKKFGIVDSADLVFRDLTGGSVVEPNGFPGYRYNDREIVRAFADANVATYDWLLAHGVVFVDRAPDRVVGRGVGDSVAREMHAAVMDWPMVQTGKPADTSAQATLSSGNGLMRPLDAAAREAGVQILTRHKMVSLYRQNGGRVLGVAVDNNGARRTIGARRSVIIATGGSSGNVNFRRMADPRLTEEYCGLAGMPWSDQDASGEIAGLAIGASLWGFYNQSGEFGFNLTKPGLIGCQYGYGNLRWMPGSSVFDRVRATGLPVRDWQDVITVNMLGQRFHDETGAAFTPNDYNSIDPSSPGHYLNAENVTSRPHNWVNAAMAGIGDGHNGGGPIWAIFDADAVTREEWVTARPNVDMAGGFFFSAGSVADLARAIVMKYQRVPMLPDDLERSVARYNSFVESGVDEDFGKPRPLHKIATPPFYAAWATPVIHATGWGLRINGKCQVIDMNGEVITGLYCGGEAAGGFGEHGLARAICQGYIAGRHAAVD